MFEHVWTAIYKSHWLLLWLLCASIWWPKQEIISLLNLTTNNSKQNTKGQSHFQNFQRQYHSLCEHCCSSSCMAQWCDRVDLRNDALLLNGIDIQYTVRLVQVARVHANPCTVCICGNRTAASSLCVVQASSSWATFASAVSVVDGRLRHLSASVSVYTSQ